MENVIVENLGRIHTADIVTILCMTVPPLLIYLLFTLIYFLKFDKKKKTNEEYYQVCGLSRFCLGGIFFLFGLILFDMALEFLLAYITEFIDVEQYGEKFQQIFTKSMIFCGISKVFRAIPTSILINFTIICTAIYTGTEGIIASLRTLKVEEGIAVELPAIKRKRLSIIFIIWCFIAVLATVYTFLIGSETVKFDLTNIYVSLGISLLILFLAERSPTLLKDVEHRTRVVKSVGDKVVEYKSGESQSYVEENEYWDDNNQIGDKITEEQSKKLFNMKIDASLSVGGEK